MNQSIYVLMLMAVMVLAMDIYVRIIYINNDQEVNANHNYNMCSVDPLVALKSYNILSMVLIAIEIVAFLISFNDGIITTTALITIVIHIIAGIVYMISNRQNYNKDSSYGCYTKAAKVHYEYMCYKIPIAFCVPWICIFISLICCKPKKVKTFTIEWNDTTIPQPILLT